MMRCRKQQGFTLIEVMIALAVVAIALAALSRAMGVTVANQAQLETRIVASWVAENELLKMHVMGADKTDRQQQTQMLDRKWLTQIRIESTAVPEIQKAVVQVTDANNEANSARLVTVVGK